jgi:uncharacterized membrane protein YgaE (UPF0421/DUF939 family)
MNTPMPHHGLSERLRWLCSELGTLGRQLSLRERLLAGLMQGLRAVASATIGYYATRLLGLGGGFWAAITAIAVTQANYADVVSLARDQLIGALIGGGFGLASAVWGHDLFWVYMLAVLLGMLTCWTLNLGAAGKISGVTTTIVMLVPIGGSFAHIAVMRVSEVVLGAVSALLVTRVATWIEQRVAPVETPPAS